MIDMGPYFEPPKKSERRMWDLMAAVAGLGCRFYSESSRALIFFTWKIRKPSTKQSDRCAPNPQPHRFRHESTSLVSGKVLCESR
jgi:hypothetical protein